MATEQTTCRACGAELDDEERADPRTRDDPWVLCDRCYEEEYEFDCCWCQESDHRDYQHAYVVVFDPNEAGLDFPGIYRVERTPYYSQPWVGLGTLHAWALTWVAHVPPDAASDYPCAHLCRGCQARVRKESQYLSCCGAVALLHA
jgi:predicted amidophosphoribosyltransferase